MEYAREMRQKQAWRSSGEKIISVMDSYAKRGGKPGLSNATKAILSRLPSKQKVDLRPFLNDLTTETLWELSAALTDCAEINLAGWEDLVPNGLRAIALNCGSTLETINFEGCPITDAMVKVSVIRLFALRSLNLSHCVGITDLSMQSLATGCKDTIRSLSISYCKQVTEQGLCWLAGTVGYASQPCAQLQSLNIEGITRMRDTGLEGLAIGCRNLKYFNCRECVDITDRGIIALAKGCKKLKVINVYACAKVSDRAMRAIGKNCPDLRSINCGRLNKLTDAGMKPLGDGCHRIQNVNLAGCPKISEGGVCYLAFNCKGLQMLNVTGCQDVTENGLIELLKGLPFVELAKTFFGFKPKDRAPHLKIAHQQRLLEAQAVARIQGAFRAHRMREWLRTAKHKALQQESATIIQCFFRSVKGRMVYNAALRNKIRNDAVLTMQRSFRGHSGRRVFRALLRQHKLYVSQLKAILRLQAVFRANLARRHLKDVNRALEALKYERAEQAQEAVTVRMQSLMRARYARQRVKALKEEILQRTRDRKWASALIQRVYRGHRGRQRWVSAARQRHRIWVMETECATLIQSVVRRKIAHLLVEKRREEVRLEQERREWAVALVQRCWRGRAGRMDFMRALRQYRKETAAATMLQRIFRGRKIAGWQSMKMDWIKATVILRHQRKAEAARLKMEAQRAERDAGRQADSASDSEDDLENDWQEFWDEELQRPFWFSASRNERSEHKPTMQEFEKSLVGSRVQIFWPMEEQWFHGTIAKFNPAKKKHRIEYDDGDHEWMVMREEQDRVQIWMENAEEEDGEEGTSAAADDFDTGGHWLEFKFCRPPDPATQWQEFHDEATGTPFYYNAVTGETSWEKPQDGAAGDGRRGGGGRGEGSDLIDHGPWSAHVDESTGETFWHNDETGESTWSDPSQARATSASAYANQQIGVYAQREVEFKQKVDEYGETYYENPVTKERDYYYKSDVKLIAGLKEGEVTRAPRRQAIRLADGLSGTATSTLARAETEGLKRKQVEAREAAAERARV